MTEWRMMSSMDVNCFTRATQNRANLKSRRQIRQPLRRGVDERGLDSLVDAAQGQRPKENEEHAESDLHDLPARKQTRAPALQRLARGETDSK